MQDNTAGRGKTVALMVSFGPLWWSVRTSPSLVGWPPPDKCLLTRLDLLSAFPVAGVARHPAY
jgi:hypothetical protein